MDNVAPLRQIDDKITSAEAVLFKPATAIRLNPETFFGTPFPVEEPQAKNPPGGALIDFYFKAIPEGEIKLEIVAASGQVIRSYSTKNFAPAARRPAVVADIWITEPPPFRPQPGMNRFSWDLHHAAPTDGTIAGPLAAPGTYSIRLQASGKTYTQTFMVKLDPRSTATPLELSKQLELSLQSAKGLTRAAAMTVEVRSIQRQMFERRQLANAEVGKKIVELEHDAELLAGTASPRDRAGRGGGDTGLAGVTNAFTTALSVAQSADRTPPATAYTIYQQGVRELAAQEAAWKRLRETDIPELNRQLKEIKLAVIEIK
jgi:hypothetical protein